MTELRETHTDHAGVLRFAKNPIIRELVDRYPGGLNQLVENVIIDTEERQEWWDELFQAIGYSLVHYVEVYLVTDASKELAYRLLSEKYVSDIRPAHQSPDA